RLGRRSRADGLVDRRLLQQPPRLFLEWVDRVDAVPSDMTTRNRGDSFDNRLVGTEDGDEVALAEDLDRPLRRAAQCCLVEIGYRRVTPRQVHERCLARAR